jgi:hypothetical protein
VGGAHPGSFKPLDKKLRQARQAQSLHDSGMSYQAIGEWLGVSGQTAWRWAMFATDFDARPRDARGRQSRKIPKYRNTRGQPPVTQRVRKLRGGAERAASGRWKPREPSWLGVYASWCPQCREHYTRQRPCCPACGWRPEPG